MGVVVWEGIEIVLFFVGFEWWGVGVLECCLECFFLVGFKWLFEEIDWFGVVELFLRGVGFFLFLIEWFIKYECMGVWIELFLRCFGVRILCVCCEIVFFFICLFGVLDDFVVLLVWLFVEGG